MASNHNGSNGISEFQLRFVNDIASSLGAKDVDELADKLGYKDAQQLADEYGFRDIVKFFSSPGNAERYLELQQMIIAASQEHLSK